MVVLMHFKKLRNDLHALPLQVEKITPNSDRLMGFKRVIFTTCDFRGNRYGYRFRYVIVLLAGWNYKMLLWSYEAWLELVVKNNKMKMLSLSKTKQLEQLAVQFSLNEKKYSCFSVAHGIFAGENWFVPNFVRLRILRNCAFFPAQKYWTWCTNSNWHLGLKISVLDGKELSNSGKLVERLSKYCCLLL
jgi:hypothetical protein